jgi:hypothetical protein
MTVVAPCVSAAAGLVATTATARAGAAAGAVTGACAAAGGVDGAGIAVGEGCTTTGSGAGVAVDVAGVDGCAGATAAGGGWTSTTGVDDDDPDAVCTFVPCVNRKKTTSAATMPRPKAAPTRTALPEEVPGAVGLSAGRNSEDETTGGTEKWVWLTDRGRIGGGPPGVGVSAAPVACASKVGGGGGLRTVGAGSDAGSDDGAVGTPLRAAIGGGVPAVC